MALTITSTPNKTISTFDSWTASTAQLRYVLSESSMTGKTNYTVKVIIAALSNLTLYFIPKSDGSLIIDLGKAIEMALPSTNYVYYRLECVALYGTTTDASVYSDYTLAIGSKRQIQETNGSNLYDYVAKPTNYGKYMTVFDEPIFWNGYLKVAKFVSQSYTQVDFTFNALDINKTFLATDTDTSLDSANKIFNMALSYPVTANAQYLQILGENTSVQITETKLWKLQEPCKNPMMIQWLNRLGALETWLFEREQSVSNIVDEGYKYNIYSSDDIATVTTTKKRIAGKDTQFITLKAGNLTQDQLQGLHDIKQSNDVRLWLDTTGTNYVTVTVDKGFETSFTTGKGNYELFLNIELPDNFDYFSA